MICLGKGESVDRKGSAKVIRKRLEESQVRQIVVVAVLGCGMKIDAMWHVPHNNWLKTLLCKTPDTTLTSLLQQLSTITCSDRFDGNCVSIDKKEPPIPTKLRF